MTPIVQCYVCERYYMQNQGDSCKAYPDGIPEEILTGEHDHTTPYKGDNGIQFEKAEES
jgi:hypothetical protein